MDQIALLLLCALVWWVAGIRFGKISTLNKLKENGDITEETFNRYK